jgi:hypothetical protein
MATVLRLTRHEPEAAQLAELQRLYGSDVQIVTVSKTVAGAAEVKALVAEHAADVLEAVLPLPILAEVVSPRGVQIPVIRAVMNRQVNGDGSATFTFDHYEKVVKVEVQTERL